jgi:hypothetical protein
MGQIGEAASDLIPGDRRIGIEEMRRAVIIGDLWDAMKARMREEVPVIAFAPTAAENQERANVAMILANLCNEILEPVLIERIRDMPFVEEMGADVEEGEIIVERDERAMVATQSQSNTQSYAATELRTPPITTSAVMRKRRGEQREQEEERRDSQARITRGLVANVIKNSAKKGRYTPSVKMAYQKLLRYFLK